MREYIIVHAEEIEEAQLEKRKMIKNRRLNDDGEVQEVNEAEYKRKLKGVSLKQMKKEHKK